MSLNSKDVEKSSKAALSYQPMGNPLPWNSKRFWKANGKETQPHDQPNLGSLEEWNNANASYSTWEDYHKFVEKFRNFPFEDEV